MIGLPSLKNIQMYLERSDIEKTSKWATNRRNISMRIKQSHYNKNGRRMEKKRPRPASRNMMMMSFLSFSDTGCLIGILGK